MKLAGFYWSRLNYTFAIPIYCDENGYYTHRVSKLMRIEGFDPIEIHDVHSFNTNSNYNLGSLAPIVYYIEEGVIFYGKPDYVIKNVFKHFIRNGVIKNSTVKELYELSSIINLDVSEFNSLFLLMEKVRELKLFEFYTLLPVIEILQKGVKAYRRLRSRKKSFKHWKQEGYIFKQKGFKLNFNRDALNSNKSYIVNLLISGLFAKGFIELSKLVENQIKTSPLNLIIKTLSDISQMVANEGHYYTAEIVLELTKIIPIYDFIVTSQYADLKKSQGNYPEAIRAYKLVLEDEPENKYGRCGLAAVYHEMGDLETARIEYEKAIKMFPDDNVILSGYATTLISQGNLAQSGLIYRNLIETNPNEARVLNDYAAYLKKLNNIEDSRVFYTKALELDPSNLISKIGIAELDRTLGNFNDSIKLYKECLGVKPRNVVFLNGLANVFKEMSEYSSALGVYEDVLQIDPRNIFTLCGIADVYLKLSKENIASKYYEQVLAISPMHHVALGGIAQILCTKGYYNDAIEIYQRLLKKNEHNLYVLNSLAMCYLYLNQIGNAKSILDANTSKYPQDLYMKHLYLHCKLKNGTATQADFDANLVSNPNTFFEHLVLNSYIMYKITQGMLDVAQDLITYWINRVKFPSIRFAMIVLLKYIKIMNKKYDELVNDLKLDNLNGPTDGINYVLNAHAVGKAQNLVEFRYNIAKLSEYNPSSDIFKCKQLLVQLYSEKNIIQFNSIVLEGELKDLEENCLLRYCLGLGQ